jgi:hypothetical protein
MTDKLIGILLMVIFGISGAGATALAWLFPALHLDKTQATMAGLIGLGFIVFQGLRFKHSRDTSAEQFPAEVQAEDKT